MQRASGWTEQGGVSVVISGTPGSDTQTFQQSFAGSTATVYEAGTVTVATIYDDNSGTAKANPFTVNSTTGFWYFYAQHGRYDVTFSGGSITTPFTVGDILLHDSTDEEIFDVARYGALGDGSTDDTTAIQAAIDAAGAVGGTVRFGGLTYRCDGSAGSPVLTFSYSNIKLLGEPGTVLDFSNNTHGDHNSYTEALMYATGTIGSATTLASDAALGDTTISISLDPGLAEGDLLLISDDETYDAASPVKKGELFLVKRISGTTVTLFGALDDAYTTGDNAQIQVVTPITGVEVRGIKLLGVGRHATGGSGNQGDLGITIEYAMDSRIVECETDSVDRVALQFSHSYKCETAFNIITFDDDNGTNTDIQYGGVLNGACRECHVHHNVCTGGKHAFLTGHRVADRGTPHQNLFEHNRVHGTWHRAFVEHASAVNTTFHANQANGCAGIVDLRNRGGVATDNLCHGSTTVGIDIGVTASDILVQGNKLYDGAGAGVNLGSIDASHVFDNIRIVSNEIITAIASVNGIAIADTGNGSTVREGVVITNNTIDVTNNGLNLNAPMRARISGNVVKTSGGIGLNLIGLRYSTISENGIDAAANDAIQLADLGSPSQTSDFNIIKDNEFLDYTTAPIDDNSTGTQNWFFTNHDQKTPLQTRSGAGVIQALWSRCNIETDSADALTIGNGVEGQEITLVMTVDNGAGTLTGANIDVTTSIVFDDVDDFAILRWINSLWRVVEATATVS